MHILHANWLIFVMDALMPSISMANMTAVLVAIFMIDEVCQYFICIFVSCVYCPMFYLYISCYNE